MTWHDICVSTEKQGDLQSLSTQKQHLKAYAGLHDWELGKVFSDAGLSAKATRRPALQAMLAWARDRPRLLSPLHGAVSAWHSGSSAEGLTCRFLAGSRLSQRHGPEGSAPERRSP
jgi:hypothetical protein